MGADLRACTGTARRGCSTARATSTPCTAATWLSAGISWPTRNSTKIFLYGFAEDYEMSMRLERYGLAGKFSPAAPPSTWPCPGAHSRDPARLFAHRQSLVLHPEGIGPRPALQAQVWFLNVVVRRMVFDTFKRLPGALLDFRGRLKGSLLALWDIARGRCHPGAFLTSDAAYRSFCTVLACSARASFTGCPQKLFGVISSALTSIAGVVFGVEAPSGPVQLVLLDEPDSRRAAQVEGSSWSLSGMKFILFTSAPVSPTKDRVLSSATADEVCAPALVPVVEMGRIHDTVAALVIECEALGRRRVRS